MDTDLNSQRKQEQYQSELHSGTRKSIFSLFSGKLTLTVSLHLYQSSINLLSGKSRMLG
jgi:hypothetical protein